jgi:hypothetical protein
MRLLVRSEFLLGGERCVRRKVWQRCDVPGETRGGKFSGVKSVRGKDRSQQDAELLKLAPGNRLAIREWFRGHNRALGMAGL